MPKGAIFLAWRTRVHRLRLFIFSVQIPLKPFKNVHLDETVSAISRLRFMIDASNPETGQLIAFSASTSSTIDIIKKRFHFHTGIRAPGHPGIEQRILFFHSISFLLNCIPAYNGAGTFRPQNTALGTLDSRKNSLWSHWAAVYRVFCYNGLSAQTCPVLHGSASDDMDHAHTGRRLYPRYRIHPGEILKLGVCRNVDTNLSPPLKMTYLLILILQNFLDSLTHLVGLTISN